MIIDSYAQNHQAQAIVDQIKAPEKNALLLRAAAIAKDPNVSQEAKDVITELSESYKLSYFQQALETLISEHLELRNRLDTTTFPREFNLAPPTGEETRITKAIATLKRCELLNTARNDKKIVSAICDLIWYPRIPKKTLFNAQKDQAAWDRIEQGKYTSNQ